MRVSTRTPTGSRPPPGTWPGSVLLPFCVRCAVCTGATCHVRARTCDPFTRLVFAPRLGLFRCRKKVNRRSAHSFRFLKSKQSQRLAKPSTRLTRANCFHDSTGAHVRYARRLHSKSVCVCSSRREAKESSKTQAACTADPHRDIRVPTFFLISLRCLPLVPIRWPRGWEVNSCCASMARLIVMS